MPFEWYLGAIIGGWKAASKRVSFEEVYYENGYGL